MYYKYSLIKKNFFARTLTYSIRCLNSLKSFKNKFFFEVIKRICEKKIKKNLWSTLVGGGGKIWQPKNQFFFWFARAMGDNFLTTYKIFVSDKFFSFGLLSSEQHVVKFFFAPQTGQIATFFLACKLSNFWTLKLKKISCLCLIFFKCAALVFRMFSDG